MDNKIFSQKQSELDTELKLQLEKQEARQTEEKTYQKINDLLQKDLKYASKADETRQEQLRREDQQNVQQIKDVLHDSLKPQTVRPLEDTNTILASAIKETEQMVKISQEAM